MLREVRINDSEWQRLSLKEQGKYIAEREARWLDRIIKGDGVYTTKVIDKVKWSSAVMIDGVRIAVTPDGSEAMATALKARQPTIEEAIAGLARMRHIDPTVIRIAGADPIKGPWTSASDKAIQAHSDAIGYQAEHVDNDGKVWCPGPVNYGLIDPSHPKGRWQGPGQKHNRRHLDCTQTLRVVWDAEGEQITLPPPTVVSRLPTISFKQARHYYAGRRAPVRWIVIHTAEAAELPTTAEALQSYAATMADNRVASWHYAVDADSITQSVREEHTAFAAPGANESGIQIELAGYARQTALEWGDGYSQRMLTRTAILVAAICKRWNIPTRRVDSLALAQGIPGICGHADVTKAFKRSTHTDPGMHFPWTSFIAEIERNMS